MDIKGVIGQHILHAIREQKIFWDVQRVEDVPLDLDEFKGKVRFVPTFAYRQLLYDAPDERAATSCRICRLLTSDSNSIGLRDVFGMVPIRWNWLSVFRDLLAIHHNNFPYFDMQILVSAKKHIPAFSIEHYAAILDFMQYSGLKSAAVQVRGSGATIPDHAHISISDEAIPIFDLPKHVCHSRDGITLLRVPEYSGALYVLQGADRAKIAHWIMTVTRWISDQQLSFNLFIDREGRVYIIPRKQEFSSTINRKMGSVEVAGIFLGNGLGTTTKDVREIERLSRSDAPLLPRLSSAKRCKKQFAHKLRARSSKPDFGMSSESWFAKMQRQRIHQQRCQALFPAYTPYCSAPRLIKRMSRSEVRPNILEQPAPLSAYGEMNILHAGETSFGSLAESPSAAGDLLWTIAKARHIAPSDVCSYINPGEALLGFGHGGSESLVLFLKLPNVPGIVVRKILSEKLSVADWDPHGIGTMTPPCAKARLQVDYLQALPGDIAQYFPLVYSMHERQIPTPIDYRGSRARGFLHEVIIDQSYVPGIEVSTFIARFQPPPEIVAHLYKEIFRLLKERIHTHRRQCLVKPTLEISYFHKIEQRIDLSRRMAPTIFTKGLLESEELWINDQSYVNILPLLERFRSLPDLHVVLEPPFHCLTIGDTNTENIVVVSNPLHAIALSATLAA